MAKENGINLTDDEIEYIGQKYENINWYEELLTLIQEL